MQHMQLTARTQSSGELHPDLKARAFLERSNGHAESAAEVFPEWLCRREAPCQLRYGLTCLPGK